MLLCGQTVASFRLGRGVADYLRRQALSVGRTLKPSGSGIYETFSLT